MTDKKFKFDYSKPISKGNKFDAGAFVEDLNRPHKLPCKDDAEFWACGSGKTVTSKLYTSFHKTLSDLPPELRSIALAYIPIGRDRPAACFRRQHPT